MAVLPKLCLASLILGCAVGKSADDNGGVLTEVLREQMKLIKHCMSTRCSGHGIYKPDKPVGKKIQVAFFAYPSKHMENVPKHTKIVFDAVTTNEGDAYNQSDGTFTAPVDGLYVFHWTTMIKPGTSFATCIQVNDSTKACNHGIRNGTLQVRCSLVG